MIDLKFFFFVILKRAAPKDLAVSVTLSLSVIQLDPEGMLNVKT